MYGHCTAAGAASTGEGPQPPKASTHVRKATTVLQGKNEDFGLKPMAACRLCTILCCGGLYENFRLPSGCCFCGNRAHVLLNLGL